MDPTLIVSIVAGVSALAGVALSQGIAKLQSCLDRKHKNDILLRMKYEELAGYLNEFLAWVMECLRAKSFDQLNTHAQPLAARKAYTLSLLYFPLLKNNAERYVEASVSFYQVLLEKFIPHEFLDAGAQAEKNQSEKFQAAGEALRAAREAFDAEIQKQARVYIVA